MSEPCRLWRRIPVPTHMAHRAKVSRILRNFKGSSPSTNLFKHKHPADSCHSHQPDDQQGLLQAGDVGKGAFGASGELLPSVVPSGVSMLPKVAV